MSTIKTQTIQPPSDSDGLTFRTNQSDRVTIGADGFVRISNGTVTGGITLNGTLNLIGGITASGGATFGGGLRINDSTASSSTSTGALVVSGGVGVGGALYAGGVARVTDSTASSSTSTGALVVSGGVGVGGALNVASTGNFSGLLTLAGATSSAIISCATAPTLGQHLTNKTYVDTEVAWYNKTYSATNPPIGTIVIASINAVFNSAAQTAGSSAAGAIGATITSGLQVNGTSNVNRYVYGTTPSGSSAVSGTWRVICYMDDDGGSADHAWVMLVRIS